MKIYFITGNKNKLEEARLVLPELKQLDIDLLEIQEIDAKLIIKEKLTEALKHKNAGFIVEDTSLCFDCLNGLPGPLIKWFLKTIGNTGLFQIVEKSGNSKAEARTIIGYAKDLNDIHYFEGSIKGKIVSPKGNTNFGWDSIFQPDGRSKTFAEMSREEKNKISMRRTAFNNLKKFINEGQS